MEFFYWLDVEGRSGSSRGVPKTNEQWMETRRIPLGDLFNTRGSSLLHPRATTKYVRVRDSASGA